MQTRCHLSVLALKQAEKYGDRAAFTYKDFGGTAWKQMSYNRFAQLVKQASNALLNLGAKPQDAIGVFSQNTIQYLITDFGAYGVRVISIPFYATASEQQIQYMINDAGIRFLFVGEQEQYDKALRIFHHSRPCRPLLRRLPEARRGTASTERGGATIRTGQQRRPLQHTIHVGHNGRVEGRNAHIRTV